jgi:hypothetical protein
MNEIPKVVFSKSPAVIDAAEIIAALKSASHARGTELRPDSEVRKLAESWTSAKVATRVAAIFRSARRNDSRAPAFFAPEPLLWYIDRAPSRDGETTIRRRRP